MMIFIGEWDDIICVSLSLGREKDSVNKDDYQISFVNIITYTLL